jgi:metal-sulfur cluster biosynthetic enzyme
MSTLPTKDQIIEKLKTVKDPELGIDIYTLGLVYDIRVSDEGIDITMTLTSPYCPFANELVEGVEEALLPLHEEVRVDVTFDPPWEPSEELRISLGLA